MLAAAEAVEETALLAHRERGRLLGVERAEADRAPPAAAERHHVGDHLAQAGALAHGADRLVADATRHACCSPGRIPSAFPASATVPAMRSSGRPSVDSASFWLSAVAGGARPFRWRGDPSSAAALGGPLRMPASWMA